ncbi:MAG: hypothetical protein PHI41_10280 [Erysipelotrichaceae bacterium]|nr:hypothetical protein [Erysipelotrichaceae bacterium]
MLKLAFPCRWHYDILRALEYFKEAGSPYDPRMKDALDIIIKKQSNDGRWKMPHPYKGSAVHFEMEQTGQPSRWNTLRAMRVLEYFNHESKVK